MSEKKTKYSILAPVIRGIKQKEIKEKEEKLGRKLNREERKQITHKVTTRVKKRARIVGLTAAIALSGFGGIQIGNRLTEGKYQSKGIEMTSNGVEIDQSRAGEINIELGAKDGFPYQVTMTKEQDEKSDFDESLKVDVNNLEQVVDIVDKDKMLKEEINKKINSFKQSDEVMEYIQQIYIDKYNKENNTAYTAADVSIYKNRENIKLYKDKANNGDEIIRDTTADQTMGLKNFGLVSLYVDGKFVEKGSVVENNGEEYQYRNVYSESKIVEQEKETSVIGKLISTGFDYATALENKEENSAEIMNTYRTRFANAIERYGEEQTKQMINQDELEER